ncbi:universal stress protein [Pelomicrobium sp. G1]|uniref:universal stress protein n=1 Tax=unclassified Pelomicrobium TaxID=2815318 RepID=UPI0021DD3E7C|nr:MAG: universal stress protein [Burkholderiales bacterium]
MAKLLVPVDGSENSLRAVDFVIKKAGWYREPVEIHLINVQPPIVSGNVTMFISQDQLNDYYQEEGLKALEPARAKLDGAQVPYKHHILVGDPAEMIARFARERGCDQILMGTRGLGAIGSLLLGSVATKVIHLADVPVLLVK